MRFADIPGNTRIKKQLVQSVRDSHVAHAQLFCGPEGSAKLALAIAYAQYINCSDKQPEDSCGTCPSCQKMSKLIHPDMHFAFPVSSTKKLTGKHVVCKNFLPEWRKFLLQNPYGNVTDWALVFGGENKALNISKEESRQIIQSLALRSYEGGYKIMLLWLPEYLHPAASNALLKILEEPAENTLFLLVSDDDEKLLSTILSRTQLIRINAFQEEDLQTLLMRLHNVRSDVAARVSMLAEGNINKALELLEEIEDDSHEMFRQWMRICYGWNFTSMVEWSEKFQKLNKVAQKSLLQYGLSIMRESLVNHFNGDKLNKAQGADREFVQRFSRVMTPDKIQQSVAYITEAHYHLERNANPKILFMDLSLNMARMLRTTS
ncbi:MAG: DNA polymerase III subunit delta [Cytophagales bacterium]|nr:DNA polymerase III subunit delta [Cytophagales bacterium]